MTLCVTCPSDDVRDTMHDYRVCGRCKQAMAVHLGEIPGLYAITEFELNSGSGAVDGGSDRPSGLRVSALNVLAGHDLLDILGHWELDWRDTYGHAPPSPTRFQLGNGGLRRQRVPLALAEIVAYLLTWLDRSCREHVAIDDFSDEMRECHAVLRVAARIAMPPSWWVTCPADSEEGHCGRKLRVTPDLDAIVRCYSCGTNWTTRRLLLVVAADSKSEVWLDPGALSEITGISERTLYRWAKAEVIDRSHGRYSLSSVRRAMVG